MSTEAARRRVLVEGRRGLLDSAMGYEVVLDRPGLTLDLRRHFRSRVGTLRDLARRCTALLSKLRIDGGRFDALTCEINKLLATIKAEAETGSIQ